MTLDERALCVYWFSDYFLDAGVVEAYEASTNDDPFAFFGVKWLLTGPLDHVKLIAPRISTFVQYQKTVIDEFGNKVLMRAVDFVPEDIVPLIPDQGGVRFVPFDFTIAYMYRYDPNSESVQVFCEVRVAVTGWMANVSITMLPTVIVQLEYIADAKYITKHGLMFSHEKTSPTSRSTITPSVSTHVQLSMDSSSGGDARLPQITPDWVSDKTRKLCFVCFKSFSLLRRRRHHCRMYGEVMCTVCMIVLPLVAPTKFDAAKDTNFLLTNQPPSKMLDVKDRRGLPVVHRIKFCQTCIFTIRQKRHAMVTGVGDYYFAEGMRLNYAQMRAAFAEFSDDAAESGYLNASLEDDRLIVDEFHCSLRIEELRQEHMEREKQKLRDQQKESIQQHHDQAPIANVLVRMLNEPTISLRSSSSLASRTPRGSNVKGNPTSDVTFSSTMPLPSPTSNISTTRQLIHIRRRSFSIPDRFEMMERSLAEQEALINSIEQQQRAKMSEYKCSAWIVAVEIVRQRGEVMRSIAQLKPSGALNQSSEG